MNRHRFPLLKLTFTAPFLMALANPAQAASSTYYLDYPFSAGSVAPSGAGPWLSVTTTDLGVDLVELKFTAALTGAEKVKDWLLNLDPTLDPTSLVFTNILPNVGYVLPTISLGTDAHMGDGSGKYDIKLSFLTSGFPTQTFDQADSLTYQVSYSGPGSIDASSFHYLSTGGGEGAFRSAAHVLATPAGGEGSAWIAPVPETSTGVLGMLGVGLACISRRRPHPGKVSAG